MSMQVRVMTDAMANCATKVCSGAREQCFFSETPKDTEKLMQLHCWPARLYKPNGATSSRYVHVEIMLRKAQLQRRRICYFSIGKDTREAR